MTDIDYAKQAQTYYGLAPVIILGSGASAAHGLPGMAALADYLKAFTDLSDLGSADLDGWSKFCEALNAGTDLESALNQVAVSESLTLRIIKATWSLIHTEDLRAYQRYLIEQEGLSLGKLLSHMFRSSVANINIVTTNYDRLSEYACEQERLHHYSGFTHGFLRHLAPPNDLTVRRKVNIWKVHGSIDWFKSPADEIVACANLNSIPHRYEPLIVTPGTQKYQRTHLEPYRSIMGNADQALSNAASYLCIGYGFNDEHIQLKLMQKCTRDGTPITIVTYALSDTVRRFIAEGRLQNFLAIERGNSDDESIIYSSLSKDSAIVVDRGFWSLAGFLRLIT